MRVDVWESGDPARIFKTRRLLADRCRPGRLSANSARIFRNWGNLGGSSPAWGIIGGPGEDRAGREESRRIVGRLGGPPESAGIPGPVEDPRQRSRIDGDLRESALCRDHRLRTGFVGFVCGPMPRAGIFGRKRGSSNFSGRRRGLGGNPWVRIGSIRESPAPKRIRRLRSRPDVSGENLRPEAQTVELRREAARLGRESLDSIRGCRSPAGVFGSRRDCWCPAGDDVDG